MFKLVALFAILVLAVNASYFECEMCKMSVDIIVPMLDEPVEDIKKAVDDECIDFFHSIPFAGKKCENFVDSELDPIIKELEGGTAPNDVCTKLSMC